jgi:hypothetical protein
VGAMEDPFEPLVADEAADDFAILSRKPIGAGASPLLMSGSAAIGRLQGFDLADRPLVTNLEALPRQVVTARTSVALRRQMLGSDVVVLYQGGDPTLPIIVGVIQDSSMALDNPLPPPPQTVVMADDDRYVISAEREIVLRCGDASITLTRAGKVIIKGRYVLSRSSGYNKIKGAAIDIN